MIDRTTKALLFAIALGLFLNVSTLWLKPAAVSAAGQDIGDLHSVLSDIRVSALGLQDDIERIQRGTCRNDKIC